MSLAAKHTDKPLSRLVIQTSSSWAQKLANDAISLADGGFDFQKSGINYLKEHSAFISSNDKGLVMQTWASLTIGNKKRRGKIQTWTEEDKFLISVDGLEADILRDNSAFISDALGIEKVEVYEAGTGVDVGGKAKFAIPLEPGIAFV